MAVFVSDIAVDLRLLAEPVSTPTSNLSTLEAAGLHAAQVATLGRALATAETLVSERAPNAPVALADAATIAIAGYLYDRPTASGGTRFANAWANSGASTMLAAYVRRRARVLGADRS